MKFKDIQIGQLFRAVQQKEYINTRTVVNDGMYLKVGHNVSVNLSKLGENNQPVDCVFDMEMQCRPLVTRARVPYHEYESYKVCAKGAR